MNLLYIYQGKRRKLAMILTVIIVGLIAWGIFALAGTGNGTPAKPGALSANR